MDRHRHPAFPQQEPTKPRKQKVLEHPIQQPVMHTRATVLAIKALAAGNANPEQQKRALDWIIMEACDTYGFPYRPGGPEGERASTLAMGRMYAGQQIRSALKMDVEQMPRDSNADDFDPTA